MAQTREQLLRAHAALPEAYQPAWGMAESAGVARRQCEDRFAVVLAAAAAFPATQPLRILDVGCAQGYFSLGLASELRQRGRAVEVVGVDSLEGNVRFCMQLAEHHSLDVRFVHDSFGAEFFERHALADFDIVLALNVLHHIRELDGAAKAEAAMATIRAHSAALLCEIAQPEEALEWVRDWHATDEALLGGYAFRRRLGEFETHLTQVRRPLYACSERLAYIDKAWFAFDRVLDRSHPGVQDRFAGQRRFFIGADTLVKACRIDGEFGQFNRSELATEARVLTTLKDEPARFPPLLAQAEDGAEAWLARGALPGTLVSELIENRVALDRNKLVHGLLGELAHLEGRGYYHDDLRAWNMLWHEGRLRLIDFGAMTREVSALHRVALAAVMAEIARGELSGVQPWYASPQPLTAYPTAWHGLIRYLLGCNPAEFSFSKALEVLEQQQDQTSATPAGLSICAEVLTACATAQVDGFARLQQHTGNVETSLANAHAHADRDRQAASQALADAASYAASLEAQIEREAAAAKAERETTKAALADSGRYAASLEAQIEREAAAAKAEREAAQAALAGAAGYARTLELEREELKEHVRQLQDALQRMQQRFRVLKPLWPGNHEDKA